MDTWPPVHPRTFLISQKPEVEQTHSGRTLQAVLSVYPLRAGLVFLTLRLWLEKSNNKIFDCFQM